MPLYVWKKKPQLLFLVEKETHCIRSNWNLKSNYKTATQIFRINFLQRDFVTALLFSQQKKTVPRMCKCLYFRYLHDHKCETVGSLGLIESHWDSKTWTHTPATPELEYNGLDCLPRILYQTCSVILVQLQFWIFLNSAFKAVRALQTKR